MSEQLRSSLARFRSCLAGQPMNVHRFSVLTAAAILVLITAGGLVTSTGSGLAVPDWPLSYGTLFPPMAGGILYEHGHRMIAAAVGLLTIVLAVWLHCCEPRRWVRRLGFLAVAAVVAQGLLGGITVLLRLPLAVSVAHACLAQAFLGLVVSIAVVTSPGWTPTAGGARRGSAPYPAAGRSLRALALITTASIAIQLVLGALVRHTGSGLAIPDFPRAFGRWVPPLTSPQVTIHFAHRLGAMAVTLLIAFLVIRILRERRRHPALLFPSLLMAPLVLLQILLGAFTVWTHLGVAPATAHVAAGALLLATSLVVTLYCFRSENRRVRQDQPLAAAPPLLAASRATP